MLATARLSDLCLIFDLGNVSFLCSSERETLYAYYPILEIKHFPVGVAQSYHRCITYQALCWCCRQTIHVDLVDCCEVYNIGYIGNQSTLQSVLLISLAVVNLICLYTPVIYNCMNTICMLHDIKDLVVNSLRKTDQSLFY